MSWVAVAVGVGTAASGYFASRSAKKGYNKISGFGSKEYEEGRRRTDEGLTGIRQLGGEWRARLKDPLGDVGRGIFARARANQSDNFVRTVNSGAARRQQLARVSGGGLTTEQIAALDAQDRRWASEGLFRSENDLSMAEGEMTLDETNRLFDRLTDVEKIHIGVGQHDKSMGFDAMLRALGGKNANSQATWSAAWNAFLQTYLGKNSSSKKPTTTNPAITEPEK